MLPANSVLYDKKLALQLIYPYKAIAEGNKKDPEGSNSQNWCSSLADLLTSAATEIEGDVVLTELAEALQLPSDLLAV